MRFRIVKEMGDVRVEGVERLRITREQYDIYVDWLVRYGEEMLVRLEEQG